jgi:methionine biosynthesis protein MetW
MKPYQTIVYDHIHAGERVIDLGCGTGQLLKELRHKKHCDGYGIDQAFDNVVQAIKEGLPVYHGDVLEGIRPFDDQVFDVAILSQTLQQVLHPEQLLLEMTRIAKRVIITFPNFGHWRVRMHLCLKGVSPKTSQLPYDWYDTPNIRVITIQEFRELCHRLNMTIIREIPSVTSPINRLIFPLRLTNLFAEKGIFVIQKHP